MGFGLLGRTKVSGRWSSMFAGVRVGRYRPFKMRFLAPRSSSKGTEVFFFSFPFLAWWFPRRRLDGRSLVKKRVMETTGYDGHRDAWSMSSFPHPAAPQIRTARVICDGRQIGQRWRTGPCPVLPTGPHCGNPGACPAMSLNFVEPRSPHTVTWRGNPAIILACSHLQG